MLNDVTIPFFIRPTLAYAEISADFKLSESLIGSVIKLKVHTGYGGPEGGGVNAEGGICRKDDDTPSKMLPSQVMNTCTNICC